MRLILSPLSIGSRAAFRLRSDQLDIIRLARDIPQFIVFVEINMVVAVSRHAREASSMTRGDALSALSFLNFFSFFSPPPNVDNLHITFILFKLGIAIRGNCFRSLTTLDDSTAVALNTFLQRFHNTRQLNLFRSIGINENPTTSLHS